MSVLTPEQIYARARAAGLGPGAATIATAIALGESRGRTDAVGDVALQDSKWGPSVGLWQVRSLNAQKGTGGTRDVAKLTDPAQNAKSMVEISNGGKNWRPWTVYTSGAYLKHTAAAAAAARKVESSGAGWTDLLDPLGVVPGVGREGGITGRGPAGNVDAVTGAVTDAAGDVADKLNPLDGVAGAVRGGVADLVTGGSRLMLTGLLVLGGVSLVAAGLVRGVAPAVQSRTSGANELASTAAMATPQGRAVGAVTAATKGSA